MSTAPRLTINLSALVANWRLLRDMSGNAETSAVVKADAYGIGIEQAVVSLNAAGCSTFFTAMVEEGVRVRAVAPDARIFILNGIFKDTVETAKAYNLSPVLSSLEQVELWAASAEGKLSALHFETGMNRLGMSRDAVECLSENPTLLSRLGAGVLMSHLACADEPGSDYNRLQQQRFEALISRFTGMGYSLVSSAGIIGNPHLAYDLTRPGISLYGAEAVYGLPNPMKPVVTAESRILQIRTAKKGEAIGYGGTHILGRESRYATCSSGYADGFHRSLSGAGVPLRNTIKEGGVGAIGKYRVPILGRVSMDLTTFDVTDVPDQVLENTEWIELFGSNLAIDDVARTAGTIGFEMLTGLGRRYHREYVTG